MGFFLPLNWHACAQILYLLCKTLFLHIFCALTSTFLLMLVGVNCNCEKEILVQWVEIIRRLNYI